MDQLAECLATSESLFRGWVADDDSSLLGPTLDRAWPVEEAPSFGELLRAIDEADYRASPSRQEYYG